MTIIISLFLIISGSISVATLLKRCTEEIIPTAFLTTVLVLYPFYCFNILKFGWYLLLGFWLLLIILYIIKLIQNKHLFIDSIKLIITPGVVIFLILCILFYLLLNGKTVGLWDEFRLWGAYPKILHYTGDLQLGNNTLLFPLMQSYPPGMPLFIYYMTSFSSTFTDGNIFYGYAILGASLFLPVLKNMKWKNIWLLIPVTATIIFFPRLYYSFGGSYEYYYNSLYIDATLGLFAGYGFYLAVTSCFNTKYDTYSFAVVLFFLIVLKDTGLLFALSAFVTALINQVFLKKRLKSIKPKIAVSIFLPLSALVLWKVLLLHYGISNHISYSLNDIKLWPLIKIFLYLLSDPIMSLNLYFGKISLSFIALSCIILFLNGYYICISKKEERKSLIASSCIMIIDTIAFILGYYVIVSSTFQGTIESYHRYMGTLMLCYTLYLFLLFINRHFSISHDIRPEKGINKLLHDLKSPTKIFLKTALTVLLIVYSVFIIYKWDKFDGGWSNAAQNSANNIISAVKSDGYDSSKKPAEIYILINGDEIANAGLHNQLYYDLLGTSANIKNFYTTEVITSENASEQDTERFVSNWEQLLKDDGYDYVYVMTKDPLLEKEFGLLFENKTVNPDTLYRIKVSGKSVLLVPAGN